MKLRYVMQPFPRTAALCVLAALVLVPMSDAASEEYTVSEYPKIIIRAPRSIGNFFKRMFTRGKSSVRTRGVRV